MIGFMPVIYPDELVYSWFARYYVHSGHSAYVFAIEDLLESRYIRPDVEFLNRLNPDAKEVITGMISMEDLILKHTMFPSVRFAHNSRINIALQSMVRQEGDVHNLLPLPKSNLPRYIRYCPVCVAEDREKYGEAFWRRSTLLRNVDVCARHRCRLKNTNILISGKQSPRLYVAETEIKDMEPEFVEDCLELQFAQYMTEVFQFSIDFTNEVGIGDFLNSKLEGTAYLSVRGRMRNTSRLYEEFTAFYGKVQQQKVATLSQLQKIFTGYRSDFYEVCQMAFFLGIGVDELANPMLPEKSQMERFNEKVAELYQAGLGCHRIARKLGSCPKTVVKANREKPKAKHDYSVRKGMKKADWSAMDEELLQKVRNTCRQIYHNDGGRPGRVTTYAVCRALSLPDKRFDYLPRCKAVIQEYAESFEVYWAREVVWAYKSLVESAKQDDIYWRNIRDITNLRRNNFMSSFPYLSMFTDQDTARRIQSLL